MMSIIVCLAIKSLKTSEVGICFYTEHFTEIENEMLLEDGYNSQIIANVL